MRQITNWPPGTRFRHLGSGWLQGKNRVGTGRGSRRKPGRRQGRGVVGTNFCRRPAVVD